METVASILLGSFAVKLCSAIALLLVLTTSLWVAYDQAQIVTGMPDRLTFRGRRPTRSATIKRRLDIAKGFRRQALLRILLSLLMVLIWGVLIPGLVLLFVLENWTWYFPGSVIFSMADGCGKTMPHPSPSIEELMAYVSTQTFTALAIDAFHGLVNAPSSKIVLGGDHLGSSLLLSGYRLYLSGYAANWVRTVAYGLYNLVFRSSENKKQIEELQKEYDAALGREGAA